MDTLTESSNQKTKLLSSLLTTASEPVYPDDNRMLEPPDPLPNSEVKRHIADGSVGLPHVRVGHRQVIIKETPST